MLGQLTVSLEIQGVATADVYRAHSVIRAPCKALQHDLFNPTWAGRGHYFIHDITDEDTRGQHSHTTDAWAPHPGTGVFRRKRREGTGTQRCTEGRPMETEAETGATQPQAEEPQEPPEAGEGNTGSPPETWPPDSLVSDSGLLDRERLNSCRFRTLRGWEFVTAAYSGVHQDPGKEWGQDGWDTAESQAFWGAGGALDVGASYHCGCYNGPEHPLTLWGLWSPGISSGWTRPAR